MKSFHPFLLAALLAGSAVIPAAAQDTNAPGGTGAGPGAGGGPMAKMMAGLTDAERQQLMAARQKALADNPQLTQEMQDLKAKHQAAMSPDADPSARADMMQAFTTYMQDMHTAMLKADPTIGPVLDKIDANRKQMMQAGGGAPGGGAPANQNGPGQ